MIRPLVALAAVAVLVSGCGSSGDSGDDADVVTPQSSDSVTAGDEEAVAAVDVCSLVTSEEIAALIGVAVDGVSNSVDPTMPGCAWENQDTYESVTINIGSPGSAPNNTLPRLGEPGFPEIESTPGPDGTRFVGGALEFAASDRYNSVQVASITLAPEAANSAMIDLANKVAPQIPA